VAVVAAAQEAADVYLESSTRRTAGWQRDQIQSVFVRGTQSTGHVAKISRAVAANRARSVISLVTKYRERIITPYPATPGQCLYYSSPDLWIAPYYRILYLTGNDFRNSRAGVRAPLPPRRSRGNAGDDGVFLCR